MIFATLRWMENYADIRFPCSEEDMDTALSSIHAKDVTPYLLSIHRPDALKVLEDRFINLDELNYLAKRLDSFDMTELSQFYAAAKHEGYTDMKNLINLTFNLPRYTVIQHISNMEAVGKRHYLSKHQMLTPEEASQTDFASIGRQLLNSGNGILTEYGILFKNEDVPYQEVYDGVTFPEYNYYGSQLMTVQAQHEGRSETLYLPCEDMAITKAIYRLGCDNADEPEFIIEDVGFDNPQWLERLRTMLPEIGIYQINEIAEVLNFGDMNLPMLTAVMEYADRSDAPAIVALAEKLDNFRFLPNAGDMDDVGRWFVESNREYNLHEDLQEYFDFESFGRNRALEFDGKMVSSGFVCMDEDCCLENVLHGTEDQAVSFGGM